MSFFDEDDEPPRTTSRTRVRPSPTSRRGRVTSGGSSDAQSVLVTVFGSNFTSDSRIMRSSARMASMTSSVVMTDTALQQC